MADDEYDSSADFAQSIEECYRAIRKRVLVGGPGWGGWRSRHDPPMEIGAPAECESPIERRLAVFLVPAAERWGFKVISQFKHDRFRYDFAIEKDGKVVAVIECDGRQFHSTPDQHSNDAAKNLSARQAGFVMFRRSGSEIYYDARGCAEDIIFQLWQHP